MIGYYLDMALRHTRQNKVLTALMVLAIAVGIGASMTTLTVMHLLSGDPLPGRSDHLYYPLVDVNPGSRGGEPYDVLDDRTAMDLWRSGRADRQAGTQFAGTYLLRADTRDLPEVMRRGKQAVVKAAPDAVLDQAQSATVDALRERYFLNARVMAALLVGVVVALLGTTALGIVGLASFWVAQRRKQIGVRRALGATRRDILRYFQIENFLIVSIGIAIGMALAFGINVALMRVYELPRLPVWYLPIGAAVLWVLGQLAVLAPARRAAAVPPVAAMRSA